MFGIEPARDNSERATLLIDVRPPKERYAGLGFIPGSVCHTFDQDLGLAAKALDRLAESQLPVLVCLTGQRSRALALALAGVGRSPLGYLTGGVLGWAAVGMPLAGRWTAGDPAQWVELAELRHALKAELTQLLDGVEVDPSPVELVLRRCTHAMGRPLERLAPHEQHPLLDWVAATLVDLRIPHAKVATLLDRMLARLPAPSWIHTPARGLETARA